LTNLKIPENILLFGLTGFGNDVLKALNELNEVNVKAVFTTLYKNPFPYYPEQQINELCKQLNIECFHGINVSSDEGIRLIQSLQPDMIIVSTFKQIIKSDVIKIPKLGIINIHPSLLPKLRGPSPVENAILNGDEVTGVTFHYLTDEIDSGNILLQKKVRIRKTDTNGLLRKKLSDLAAKMVPELMQLFSSGVIPVGTPQDTSLSSQALRPKPEDVFIENCKNVQEISRKIRALNPHPGTSILIDKKRIPINRFRFIDKSIPLGIYRKKTYIDFFIDSKGIRLYTT